MAMHFKNFSETGNVPFGAARRHQREEANSKNIPSMAQDTFKWTVPTVMK